MGAVLPKGKPTAPSCGAHGWGSRVYLFLYFVFRRSGRVRDCGAAVTHRRGGGSVALAAHAESAGLASARTFGLGSLGCFRLGSFWGAAG